jgi:acetylornithine deacetylase/succinyl-diaminopimelate desuccinylase-like protein
MSLAERLIETLRGLAVVPTHVDPGFDTLMDPDHPRLVAYVQEHVRPRLEALGARLHDAGSNNLVVEVGAGGGPELLIQNYTVSQHHNLMERPYEPRIESAAAQGFDEPALFALGVSQTKAHQATMLAVLEEVLPRAKQLRGRLWWAVNNEGRSSHECSHAILDTIAARGGRPQFAIIQQPTGLRLSLGNRGRSDVEVTIEGRSGHSSRPDLALSAIDGAVDVANRLRALRWADRHPLLGERQAVVYKMAFHPLAPHTLPAIAYLTVDRRLLPGDDPDAAAAEVERAIGDLSPYRVTVRRGVTMLPALVAADNPWVRSLERAHAAVTGASPEFFHLTGTFDAGGPSSRGIPTVQYGCGVRSTLTGDDFVTVSSLQTEARVLGELIAKGLER